MKLKRFAYIFLFFETDSDVVVEKDNRYFKSVGIDPGRIEEVLAIAKRLYQEGYELIELCGGFDAEWVCKVSQAVNHKIPTGKVFYGPEHYKTLIKLG